MKQSDVAPSIDFDASVSLDDASGSVAGLAKYARKIPKGTIIFDQDEDGETMYFVIEGRIRISKVVGDRIQPIAVIEQGDFFGEMALLSNEGRSARAETLTDSNVVELDHGTFKEFLRSNHEAAIRMLFTLVKRLQKTDELVENLMFDDPQAKVAATVLRTIRSVSKEERGYLVPMDVHELMIASGTDTRLLRIILKRFRDAGFVEIYDGAIFVRNKSRLQQYNNFLKMKGNYLQSDS